MKKLTKLLFILAVLSILIISCGKKEQKSSNEIVQWSEFLTPTIPLYKLKKPLYDKYLAENPLPMPFAEDMGPALYRERFQRYILQGKTGYPDLIEATLEQVYSYVSSGLASPIEDLFEKDPEKDVYQDIVVKALTIDGHMYAFPGFASVRLLIYRKDLLEKHNLQVPKTWDELVNVAKTLKEKENINGFMFTTKEKEVRAFQEFMTFYYTLADNIYEVKDGKATYIADKKNFEKVLQLYKDLFAVAIDNNAKSQDWKTVDYGITGGQVAITTCGPWIWSHMTEEPARGTIISNLGVAPIPVPEGGQPGTYMEVKGLVINPYIPKEKRESVYKALKTMVSQPVIDFGVKYEAATSIRKDVKSDIEFGQSFADNLHTGKVLEFINWETPQNYIIEAIQNVIYDKLTPAQAADMLEKQFKEYESKAVMQNK